MAAEEDNKDCPVVRLYAVEFASGGLVSDFHPKAGKNPKKQKRPLREAKFRVLGLPRNANDTTFLEYTVIFTDIFEAR